MARPGWATAVAVVGIILGCSGIAGGIQSPFIPAIVSSQLNQLESRDSRPEPPPLQVFHRLLSDLVHAMTDGAPFWFEWWLFLAAGLDVAVFGIYLYASIALFQMRPWSAKMFAWSSAFVVLLHGISAFVGSMAIPMLRPVAVVGFGLSSLLYLGMAALVISRRKEVSSTAREGPP